MFDENLVNGRDAVWILSLSRGITYLNRLIIIKLFNMWFSARIILTVTATHIAAIRRWCNTQVFYGCLLCDNVHMSFFARVFIQRHKSSRLTS